MKRRLDTSRSPSLCRRRATTQVRVDVRGLCSSVMRRPSPERHCVPKVRENARGVCVARWYDPATGEFTSVDPDLAETDQAYAYAGDDPVNTGTRADFSLAFSTLLAAAHINGSPMLHLAVVQ